MPVVHLNKNNFEAEVMKSDLPVLVDFWAEWCGPCRMIGPVIDEIAGETEGKLKVAKVNIDEAQELAARYNVMSIPNLLVFKGGEPVEQMIGAIPKDQILAKVQPFIS